MEPVEVRPAIGDSKMTARLFYGVQVMDGLRGLDDESVQAICSSPPYYAMRDYEVDGQVGLEETHLAYCERLVEIGRELRRVLRPDGVFCLNLGDTFHNQRTHNQGGAPGNTFHKGQQHGVIDGRRANPRRATKLPGLKDKDLIGIPWRAAFALQADGWWLRDAITWCKPNPRPDRYRDRCTQATEMLFLLTRNPYYHWDTRAISDVNAEGDPCPPKSWWEITVTATRGHHAVMPEELARRCVRAGSRPGDTVLDPFSGSGTTGKVALAEGRHYIGIDLNPDYLDLAVQKISGAGVRPTREFESPGGVLDMFGVSP